MDITSIVSLIPQGGSIVALITVVIVFLRHIEVNTQLLTETHRTCEEKLEHLTDRCEVVIQDNTKAVTQMIEMVKEIKSVTTR